MPRSDSTARDRGDTLAQDVASAKRVLATEASGLSTLAAALDGSLGPEFVQAVDVLHNLQGRVVATGMGKSGHVARKVAATMASVGTPAFFVHPGEASHGDLGMITGEDAVIALSNSGETKEMSDLVAYSARYSIPLIAITSRPDSALAESASVPLVLPRAEEACPLGLAPTTSTTMMLALGDALAVALLERKGFTEDQFHMLHPGGKLGRSLIRVEALMHTGDEIPLVQPDMPMADALITMTAKRFGCVGVTGRGGRLDGIITDGDLRRHMGESLLSRTAGEIMTANPKTIRPGALAAEALGLMNNNAITSLFVIEDDRPVGILHIHDCLRAGIA